MEIVTLIFKLLVCHAVADYGLQNAFMAEGKNPKLKEKFASINLPNIWIYLLSSHALTHGGAVFLATGNIFIGILETFLHFVIDLFKCLGLIGLNADQILHLVSKLFYVYYIFYLV